jgi:micrococcal nuclease
MIRRYVKYSIFILLFITTSCESKSKQKRPNNSSNYFAVIKVVDGDTFWADNGSEKGIKIRLIGVDAPESRKTFKKDVGYYGKESKQYLTNLISGQLIRLESDVDSLDRYGRTLSYVYLKNGTFINAELVKNGYAMVMTVPPNVKYADLFVSLQKDARENNRGLWKQ